MELGTDWGFGCLRIEKFPLVTATLRPSKRGSGRVPKPHSVDPVACSPSPCYPAADSDAILSFKSVFKSGAHNSAARC